MVSSVTFSFDRNNRYEDSCEKEEEAGQEKDKVNEKEVEIRDLTEKLNNCLVEVEQQKKQNEEIKSQMEEEMKDKEVTELEMEGLKLKVFVLDTMLLNNHKF